MSLALMVLVGMTIGGAAFALLWWTIQREHQVRAAKVNSPTAEPVAARDSASGSPAPAITPTAGQVGASNISPVPSLSPSPTTAGAASNPPLSVSPPVPHPTPYFVHFLHEYKSLHKGYNTYRVISLADNAPREYFARLGLLSSEEIRLLIYVVRSYAAREVVASVVDNYDRIVEELKAKMRNEGVEILGLKVSHTVVVYLDIDREVQIPIPEDAGKKGLSFYFERRTTGL